ncbi:MAG: protein kinase [archaeon]|nr:protein kinase [archaeon]
MVDGNIYALKKVKLLNLSEKEKLNSLNEVRLLASVKSNFVISYKEAFFDEKDSTLGIVMEFADNGDLYQQIVEHKKAAVFFEESEIWRVMIQLVKGLKALHDLKILHRDLKSANVFLLTDGSAKLGDLNVSKVARRGLGYTQTGTPYYASPEVWKDQPYDNKSDIWSLGCVLYEMITLRPPFRAENMEGLYNKVIKGQIHRIPERFSSDLDTMVRLLIQVHPENRPSCDQILKHPIIQKRIEYFKAYANDDETEDQALLKTIKIPKNLLFLSDKLPKPNYQKTTSTKNANTNNYRSFSNNMDSEYSKGNTMHRDTTHEEENNPTSKEDKQISPIHVNKRLEPIKGRGKKLLENTDGDKKEEDTKRSRNEEDKDKEKEDNKITIEVNEEKKNEIKEEKEEYSNIHGNGSRKETGNSHRPIIKDDRKADQIIARSKHDILGLQRENSPKKRLVLPSNIKYLNEGRSKDLPQLNIISSNRRIEQQRPLMYGNLKMKYLGGGYRNNNSNSRMNDLYRIYAPYLNNQNSRINNDRSRMNPNMLYLKNIEKYYDKMQMKKKGLDGPEIKILPKRKLSPIKRRVIKVYS